MILTMFEKAYADGVAEGEARGEARGEVRGEVRVIAKLTRMLHEQGMDANEIARIVSGINESNFEETTDLAMT